MGKCKCGNLPYFKKNEDRSGISQLDITVDPDKNGEPIVDQVGELVVRQITLKDKMEEALISYCNKYCRQGNLTPFNQEPLKSMFDYTAESEFCHQFREEGKVDIDSLKVDDDVKIFLDQLALSESDPPKLSAEITREQLITGFKIWPEKLSTSPEGRHLGHYKAWIHKEMGNKVKDEMTPNSFFDSLHRIIQISIKSGSPLRRWNTVHKICIRKEAGNLKIHRPRIIHKLDAKLNLIRR
eukprot:scaffold39147_cov55-Attheya_sp.AAC.8